MNNAFLIEKTFENRFDLKYYFLLLVMRILMFALY